MTRMARLALLAGLLIVLGHCEAGFAAGWKGGTARVAITPKSPVWMAGYGARSRVSEGVEHDLWAKALALVDPAGKKALLVTLDVCGIDRALSIELREAIEREQGLTRDRIVLACSHTHSGPVVGENLITMYRIDAAQRDAIKAYTAFFVKSVLRVSTEAFSKLEPVELAWESGRADFAVNRRENKENEVPALRAQGQLKGPVDHDVPVLRINGADHKPKGIVFGYACHCTVLDEYKLCGDYAGFTQVDLEERFPSAQAMFVAGCGADQNPVPRRSLELAKSHGKQLAEEVGRVIAAPMRRIDDPLKSAYEEIPLRFDTLPTREQVELDASSKDFYLASRARKLLKTFNDEGGLASTYPYPVQVWKVGELTWILLGGEVVVDYSLRLKRNLGSSHTWVSGYCNDVMAYIPSRRVLKEGGYEGEVAMIYYGLPARWAEEVEEKVVESVYRLLGSLAREK